MMKNKEQVHRQPFRSAHEEIRVRRRSRCGDEAWFLRIFHDATSGRRGFRVLCSHLFMKNRARNLVQSPVQKLAEKGDSNPRGLIRTCTLSRGVHSTSLPLLRRNPSACDRGRCVSQAGCSCICRRIGLVISVDPRTSGVKA